MRVIVTLAVVVVLAVIAAFAFGLINISQTREAKLPEVAVSGGQAPAFHVDTAKVAAGPKRPMSKCRWSKSTSKANDDGG
jgi:hypothetical protein